MKGRLVATNTEENRYKFELHNYTTQVGCDIVICAIPRALYHSLNLVVETDIKGKTMSFKASNTAREL